MISLNRFRPLLQIGLWLVLLVVLLNCALHVLSATPVLSWLPKVVSGSGYLEDNRQRVAAAVQEYQDGRIPPDQYLCVIVGISNVREGVDLRTIAEDARVNFRYLGLGGAGLGMPDVARHAQTVLTSDLRPDLVIVGFALHQLVDTLPKPGTLNQGFLDHLRRGDFRNAAIAIRDWIWFYTRRKDVSLTTEAALLDARASLFRFFHVQVRQSSVDHHSPWREMLHSDWPEHFSRATLQEEAQFFESLGVFDMQTYIRSPKAPAILVRLLKQFRTQGAEVVILLMPEHPQLRQREPAGILPGFYAALHKDFKNEMPPVLDCRDAVDETGFVDLAHLNEKGRARLSVVLAERIRQFRPRHPPLMKQAFPLAGNTDRTVP